MGDRTYASITIGGHIATREATELLCEALIADSLVSDKDEARSLLLVAIDKNAPAFFDDDEVNYGTFPAIDKAIEQTLGLTCTTKFDAGGGYGAGYHTITGTGETLEIDCLDDQPAYSLQDVEIFIANPDRAREMIAAARLASGANIPPLTVSDEAREALTTIVVRLDPTDGNGIPIATPAEADTVVSRYGSDNIEIDVEAQVSRREDGTWVQAWVRLPTKTISEELLAEGASMNVGRWMHPALDGQWIGETSEEFLQRLRDVKAGLSF